MIKKNLILLSFIIFGCAKAPIRSDVEGFWRLERFTVIDTDEIIECNRLFYSITRQLIELSDKGSGYSGNYIARMNYYSHNTVIQAKDFKVRGGTADTGEDAPLEGLRNFGINSQKETEFQIIQCNGEFMILQSDYARLELKKF